MRLVYWGTYDRRRERYRILVDALRENGIDIVECHEEVWSGIRDKSMVSDWSHRLRIVGKYIFAYLKLIGRYLFVAEHDAVLVGYLGHFDVLVLWPLARLRRKPIIWDAVTSLYDTVASDRRLIPTSHPLARILFLIEWVACHSASRIILPSNARAADFAARYGLCKGKTRGVFLGVETKLFPSRPKGQHTPKERADLSVLFYGQFIPLHGVDTIVYAARLMRTAPVNWTIIGSGQVEGQIRELLEEMPLPRLKWIPWVPYGQLSAYIHSADVALGIFGDSEKAATSIPNKVFQILSTGTPLITRDSPAIREIVNPTMPGIYLVAPKRPETLVNAIERFRSEQQSLGKMDLHSEVKKVFQPDVIGSQLAQLINECLR